MLVPFLNVEEWDEKEGEQGERGLVINSDPFGLLTSLSWPASGPSLPHRHLLLCADILFSVKSASINGA